VKQLAGNLPFIVQFSDFFLFPFLRGNAQEMNTYPLILDFKGQPAAAPDNFIIWFRDHPSVLVNEASPGFASDIRIANFAWTAEKVSEVWEQFCASLMGTTEPAGKDLSIYPNPLGERLVVEIPEDAGVCSISIYNPNGQVILFREMCKAKAVVDVIPAGQLSRRVLR
jgi:hypothetical protein